MVSMHGGDIAIVGAAETARLGKIPDQSALQLHTEAAVRALADAGVSPAEVDGIANDSLPPFDISDYLGIRPRWVDGTWVGGCSSMLLVRHAAAAIAAGAANVVLVTHGESGRSSVGQKPYQAEPASLRGQFEVPFGGIAAYSTFTTPVLAFLEGRGMSARDLAVVTAAQREWAVGNPRAARNEPTTVEDVLAGPEIAYPFTRDMCCVVTDGGGALVVMSAERARDLPSHSRAVYLLGSGEAAEAALPSQMDQLDSFGAFRSASTDAFQSAGITHRDVDHVMFYDAFAHLPLYMLEDTGFVGRGESGAFFAEGHSRPGGDLPINTNGGGMSYTHTGRYGMFAMQEAVRQLRGEAFRQVDGVEISFVQGIGFSFGSAGSLVLSNRRP
ncbi:MULTISPECIES: thiolase C-terminal domain-containing protein [unclassified Streptosporangium]|uniref:thiolase C-terminal domain-containing protein n=1 Tax=Streptosporangium sp. NPDC005286 TaxID=3154463 RepID=UPI0033A73C5F